MEQEMKPLNIQEYDYLSSENDNSQIAREQQDAIEQFLLTTREYLELD